MKRVNVILICIGIIMVFLLTTNPTITDFREFIPAHARISSKGYKSPKVNVAKKADYLICSVYEYEIIEETKRGDRRPKETGEFIGLVKNFYQKSPPATKTPVEQTAFKDSLAMAAEQEIRLQEQNGLPVPPTKYTEDGLPILKKP